MTPVPSDAARTDLVPLPRISAGGGAPLRESDKVEALGTLAGGIAHGFNNLLQKVLGFAELVADDPNGPRTEDYAREIVDAAERGRVLVDQILAFNGDARSTRESTDLAELVGETLATISSTLPDDVDLDLDLRANDAWVLADPVQMHQVVMNLWTNAIHAMSSGGVLGVCVDRVELAAADVGELAIPPGSYARLSFSDDGHGMSDHVLRRIFEPFFTTKSVGEGAGLGLSAVHGIVRSHDGGLEVESREGEGTTFHLYFPACQEPTCGDRADALRTEFAHARTEHVLVVDDEPAIVMLETTRLEELGFRASGATSTAEALELLRDDSCDVDVVITDYLMPGTTGIELTRALRRERPDVAVVLSTGYRDAIVDEDGMALVDGFLPKPHSTGELEEALRAVLAASYCPEP